MRGRGNGKIRDYELIVHCRGCLTLETLRFKGDTDTMYPTRKFWQGSDKRVYHDCGTDKACRLFPRFAMELSSG